MYLLVINFDYLFFLNAFINKSYIHNVLLCISTKNDFKSDKIETLFYIIEF